MAAFFKSSEIYRMAIELEKNGLAYYTEIARQATNEQTKAVFTYLATIEKKHLRKFRKLLANKSKSTPPESYRGEYMKYLRALLKDRLFTSSAAARSRAAKSGSKAAISTGIQAEKNSILFYSELLDLVPADDREALVKILTEEKRHLSRLMDYKNSGCI